MSRQTAALATAENVVMDHLRTASIALTAREVASLIGWPPQRVIWALQRLVAKGSVSVSEGERKDSQYRVRRFARYRPAMAPKALYPAWMMPMATVVVKARLVRGRASLEDD